VSTPESGPIGNIMRQVLLRLEQADLLVADITGGNCNVLYELGVYHAFGKPCILLAEKPSSSRKLKMPFDLQEYRCHSIDFADIKGTIKNLRPEFAEVIGNIDKLDYFSNPVTDFY